jgi:hypothetical protein
VENGVLAAIPIAGLAHLIDLMGASLATGGLAFFGDSKKGAPVPSGVGAALPPVVAATVLPAARVPLVLPGAGAAPAPPAAGAAAAAVPPALALVPAQSPAPRPPLALSDIFLVFPPPEGELSLSKAQMLFWTILLLTMFMSKSILDGVIWEVPWALVALMGFSQAGYLVPKLSAPTAPVQPAPQADRVP